jgi:hypothetical protein
MAVPPPQMVDATKTSCRLGESRQALRKEGHRKNRRDRVMKIATLRRKHSITA